MPIFDDRDKGFENKFAHEEELAFKANARRNKLLALWAAAKMKKTDSESESYALSLIEFGLSADDGAIRDRLLKDFAAAKASVTVEEVSAEIRRLTELARKQLAGATG